MVKILRLLSVFFLLFVASPVLAQTSSTNTGQPTNVDCTAVEL